MEPKHWQLRNRIKYVELLRSGTLKELYKSWDTQGCGVCAIGAATRVFREPVYNEYMSAYTSEYGPFLHPGYWLRERNNDYYPYYREYLERQRLSSFYGWSYKEIRDISNRYEGLIYTRLSHKQIADYVEKIHINPYLWMIEKHYNVIKEKCIKELKEACHE